MLSNIFDEIEKAHSIVILTHKNPDGDAMSCSLAFGMMIHKDVDIVIPNYPKRLNFLPNADKIKRKGENKVYDLAIALDTSEEKRLVGYDEYYKNAKVKINIDHHDTNTFYGDVNYVLPDVPACAQILADMFFKKDLNVSIEIATCLVAGILSDTSGLVERNINADTFYTLSKLLGYGVDYKKVYEEVIGSCSREIFRIKQLVVSRVVISHDIAISYLLKKDIEGLGLIESKYLLKSYMGIEGVKVVMLLTENEGFVRVSLRSNVIDVSKICEKFGGGGHIGSAGCNVNGSIEEVAKAIYNEIL